MGMRILAFFVVVLVFVEKIVCEEDLYNVLGIRKTASNAEIKRAYKRLAREWHPDKNNAPGANEHFMKINEAYETLADQEKRNQYDNFGTTSAQGGQQNRGPGNPFGGFEHFFQQGKFSFNFGGFKSDNIVDNQRITLRAYMTKVLPESRFKPTLLYVYSDFCYHCMQVELIWEKVTQDMEEIGVGIGSVQMQLDRPLASKLRISNVPSIVGVVDGRLRYFGSMYSVSAVRSFVRKQFYPPDTVEKVTDKNYEAFLEGWKDNRVRMLLFDNRPEPTLRYISAAFANRDRVAAGYVNTQTWGTKELQSRFNIQNGMETLLLFNEETQKPAAALTMKKLPRSTMDQLIDSNRFLQLPRLSSQSVFNQLCPVTTALNRKKLCVMLLSKSIEEHEPYRETFRKYARDHLDPKERVRYVYVYEDSQYHFVNKLTKGLGAINETNLKVAVVWRKEQKTLHFDWLEDGWPLEPSDVKLTRRRLHRLVDWFLSGSTVLPLAVEMPFDLVDEYAENLGWRILKRLVDWADALWEKLLSLDDVTVVTMVMSVVFVFVIGYMMRTLVHMEEDTVNQGKRRQQPRSGRKNTDTPHPGQIQRPTVYMHHLTHETFESLIEGNQFGVRTIVIFVDQESQDKLIQQFAQVVLPYARSDAFKFALLRVDHYLTWFRTILESTLDSKRNLRNINQKNCIGTVLAINGPRKYYCMFHAQQKQEAVSGKQAADGKFIGFDDDSEEDSEEDAAAQKLFESDLLTGFSNWMDRLCEGTLRRFRMDSWPKMEPPSESA